MQIIGVLILIYMLDYKCYCQINLNNDSSKALDELWEEFKVKYCLVFKWGVNSVIAAKI